MNVIKLSGADLDILRPILADNSVHTLRVVIDKDGLKIKVNRGIWSRPLGITEA